MPSDSLGATGHAVLRPGASATSPAGHAPSPQKGEYAVEHLGNGRIPHPRTGNVEPVPPAWQYHQLVFYATAFQFLCHENRLLAGNVCVLITVKQQRGGELPRHVAERAEGIKPLRLLIWIVSRHHLRPQALLATIEVEAVAIVKSASRKGSSRQCAIAHVPKRLLLRHGRLLAVEGVGTAVPGSGDVAIAVE